MFSDKNCHDILTVTYATLVTSYSTFKPACQCAVFVRFLMRRYAIENRNGWKGKQASEGPLRWTSLV